MSFYHFTRQSVLKLEGEKSAAFGLARSRLVILSAVFVVCYIFLALRVADLAILQGQFSSVISGEDYAYVRDENPGQVRRGRILDRNGEVLASSLGMVSLYADPLLISDKGRTARALAQIFPDKGEAQIYQKLNQKGRFVWLARGILPAQQQAIFDIGEPGLAFQKEDRRIYPQGSLAAHLLGYTNVDGQGLAGLERFLNARLNQGEDVKSTLDLRLQHILRREIERSMRQFDAVGGTGVILDAQNGGILAGVSLPDYDPHHMNAASNSEKFNRLNLGVYELGSIFKIFSTAAALDQGFAAMDTLYDAREPLQVGRFKINDFHAQKRIMNLPEVFMHSSNIGTGLMVQELGGQALRDFYHDLGLLAPLQNAGLSEAGRPIEPRRWGEIETITAAYGHGIATTPLHLAAAVASIVNDGKVISPTLTPKEQQNHHDLAVISPETSLKMRQLLRLTVAEGTGGNADVPGYLVGGKTGTAEKPGRGGYDGDKLISSFVGAFPMTDPRYVLLVSIDEPKGNEDTFGYATAGWVAAPAVARVIAGMVNVLNIPPFEDVRTADDDFIADLKIMVAHEGGVQ